MSDENKQSLGDLFRFDHLSWSDYAGTSEHYGVREALRGIEALLGDTEVIYASGWITNEREPKGSALVFTAAPLISASVKSKRTGSGLEYDVEVSAEPLSAIAKIAVTRPNELRVRLDFVDEKRPSVELPIPALFRSEPPELLAVALPALVQRLR